MNTLPCPVEDSEQIALLEWCKWHESKYPALKWIAHCPNGGKRSKSEAARFKKMGVRKGFPDIMLHYPNGKHYGLFLEMKRLKGGKVESEQQDWIDYLNSQGYLAVVCRGWKEASEVIIKYLERDYQK